MTYTKSKLNAILVDDNFNYKKNEFVEGDIQTLDNRQNVNLES